MAAKDSNLAYDIPAYQPKERPNRPRNARKEKPSIQMSRNTQTKPVTAQRILFIGILIALLGVLLLIGQVESNRLYNEITKLESEIRTLNADNAALAAEYDSRTSLKSVEEYAKDTLGLQKLDKSQIEYVEFDGGGVIEVVETEKKNIFIRIKNWLEDLGEYLGA